MERWNTNQKSSLPESEELIDCAKALRKKSHETSRKLEEMLEKGEKFLHNHREGADEQPEETEPS